MKMFDLLTIFKAPSFVRIAFCYVPPMFRAKAKSRFVFPDKRKRAIACPSRAICVSKRLSKAAPAPNPRNCGLDSLSVSVTLSTRIRYSVYTAWPVVASAADAFQAQLPRFGQMSLFRGRLRAPPSVQLAHRRIQPTLKLDRSQAHDRQLLCSR